MYNEDEMQSRKSDTKVLLFCAAAFVYKHSKNRPKMRQIVEALEMKILKNEIWEMNKDSVNLEHIPQLLDQVAKTPP
ncbi:hypothetical protein M5689_013413 [Euphorbia peplus]|nr:hypothetical protein M5689_013413 [Euphorbia peplus]